MKAIILAAGVGTRIWKDIPKCLIEINGMPIVRKQVESLQANGITDVSVAVGFKEDMVKEECKGLGLKFYTNPRFRESGMLESLFCAKQELNDEFLLVYGDVYFEKEVIEKLLACKADFCLAVDATKEIDYEDEVAFEGYHGKAIRKGRTKVYAVDGIVKKISKSLAPDETTAEYIGIAKFSERGTKIVFERIKQLIESREITKYPSPSYLFRYLMDSGEKISAAFVHQRQYSEIDYEKDLEEAREKFEKGKVKGILFDAEDVIYVRDEETLKPILDFFKSEGHKVDSSKFKKAYKKDKLLLYKGKISKDEHLRRVLGNLGIKPDKQFLEKFAKVFRESYSNVKTSNDIKPLFKKLKQQKIKVGILTDTLSSEEKRWEFFKEKGLAEFIDIISCSSETGFIKNEKEAYFAALKKLGLRPQEALFVGHTKYEMQGAAKAGVKAVSLVKGIGEDIHIDSVSKITKLI